MNQDLPEGRTVCGRPESRVHLGERLGQGVLILEVAAFASMYTPVETLTLPEKIGHDVWRNSLTLVSSEKEMMSMQILSSFVFLEKLFISRFVFRYSLVYTLQWLI